MESLPLPRQLPDHQRCSTVESVAHPSLAPETYPTPAPQPFAWQNGNQLLLLDVDGPNWVVAELEFLPDECRYVEIRCIAFEWPREAIGALLARALSSGDDALITTVEHLHSYMDRHYDVHLMDC